MKDHDSVFDIVGLRFAKASCWSRVRRGVLTAIGVGCFVLGMVLIATLIRPDTLQQLSTLELCAMVGLITLPALTLLSIRYDRKTVRYRASRGYQSDATRAQLIGDPIGRTNHATQITHEAHKRTMRGAQHLRASDVPVHAKEKPIDKRITTDVHATSR